ncbi:MAG: fasciclin domain-containing protein [Bacteroidetes bacterium]|nr:fasciclin domain-containing protein [Bacteroidota bacterium]
MKRLKLNIGTFGILFALVIFLASCSEDDDNNNVTPQMPAPAQSIVDIATSNDDFSILVDALAKADLVTALQGDGPFTVFAPTNSAFEMLFEALDVNGIEDLSAEALTPILLYHVVATKAMSTDLSTGYYETISTGTPDGKGMVIYAEVNNGVMINNSAMVTNADIEATNGVVHVIDEVILPPTVVDLAIQNANFSILVEAVVKAGLVEALSAEGPFTVFAPTNAAFEAAFEALDIKGLEDLSADALIPILTYHVVADNVLASEVTSGMVPTLNTDSNISISVTEQGVVIDNTANVIATDVQGSNGVIHVIDNVILPN